MFVMGVVAASASAANPEFGRCINTKAGGGIKYDSAKCITTGGERENWEWYPAFGGAKPLEKTGFTTTLKPETIATLEFNNGTKFTCKGLSATGEYTGNKTVSITKMEFTGCGPSCSNVVPIKELEGELGLIKKGSPSTKDQIGMVLWPKGGTATSGSQWAEFSCIGGNVRLKNSIIAPVTENSMQLIATIKYSALKGVQKPTNFLGGPDMFLESSFSGAPYEPFGISDTTLQTNEEKVEIRSL
jgi:hypothetical protein